MDFDPRVVGIASQPFWLHWYDGKRKRRHAPDYFVRHADGSGVVDVRADERIAPKDAEAFELMHVACQHAGWEFARLGAADAVMLANVRWLSRYYRHPRCLHRVSHDGGHGPFDAVTGEKIARDRDPDPATSIPDAHPDLTCPGLGPVAGTPVRIAAGLFGSGLHSTTPDGWTLDIVSPEWLHDRVSAPVGPPLPTTRRRPMSVARARVRDGVTLPRGA